MPILFFVLRGGNKFSAFVDKGGKQATMIVCTTMAEIEAEFYEYLTSALPADEAAAFAATLHKLYTASKTESRAGFPHFKQSTEGEAEHAE